MLMTDLFDGIDEATLRAIAAANGVADEERRQAVAHRTRTRHAMRRANAEKTLAEILPASIEPGDAWHVISRGDIDALSYLQHVIGASRHFDTVALSTWCMAAPDLEQLRAWLDAGLIDQLDLYLGEIFPSQYGDEHALALALEREFGARIVIARNHSKVILAGCAERGEWLVMEGSANVNTNPRIEQTTVTHDRALFDFYLEFFRGLRSIDKRAPAQ